MDESAGESAGELTKMELNDAARDRRSRPATLPCASSPLDAIFLCLPFQLAFSHSPVRDCSGQEKAAFFGDPLLRVFGYPSLCLHGMQQHHQRPSYVSLSDSLDPARSLSLEWASISLSHPWGWWGEGDFL